MTRRIVNGAPAIILGGDETALSIARSLGRLGVRVIAVAHPDLRIRYSRHVELVQVTGSGYWDKAARFLQGADSDHLKGAVVLATNDEGIAILAEHRTALERKFLLDLCNPEAQRIFLDKIATYEVAREIGVPTPRFWLVDSRDDLRAVSDELVYPLIIKPRLTHLFKALFEGKKHLVANDAQQVEQALAVMEEAGLQAFLVEKIPGPDSLLCSYYTYLDREGEALFHFTKRVFRRLPKNQGQSTYHITDHVPGIQEISLKLFRHVGLQGVTNVEYKMDPRDGEPKLIEVNARFVGANSLATSSGIDIGELVYRQIIGQTAPGFDSFRDGVRLWHPRRDFLAYRELSRLGELTFWQWLQSVMHPQTLPFWSWSDPGPALMPLVVRPLRALRNGLRRRRS